MPCQHEIRIGFVVPKQNIERRVVFFNQIIFKKSVDDWKWKRDREETAETIKEIERKKTRVAPAYNKGATQYITDGADPTTLGRKV